MNATPTRSIREWLYQRIWRDQYTFGNRILLILLVTLIAIASRS